MGESKGSGLRNRASARAVDDAPPPSWVCHAVCRAAYRPPAVAKTARAGGLGSGSHGSHCVI